MAQPEARVSRNIMAALRQRGAFVFKIHGSKYMMAGLPDIVGVYRGHFIGVETKMPDNTTSRIQDHVISKLREAGATIVVAHSVAEALTVLDRGSYPGGHPAGAYRRSQGL